MVTAQEPAERPGQLVLHFQWQENGLARQETYGPWEVDPGDAHVAAIQAFMTDWKRTTGLHPDVVTMALVQDPDAWLRARKGEQ